VPKLTNQPVATMLDRSDSNPCREDVFLDVRTLAGTNVCTCRFARSATVLQLRQKLSMEMGIAPSELDLVLGTELLTVSEEHPLEEVPSEASMTVLRRTGVTLVASLQASGNARLTEQGLSSMCSPHGTVKGLCLGESGLDAYVTCDGDDDAKAIIRALSGRQAQGTSGTLTLTWAQKPTVEVSIEGMRMCYRLTETDLTTLFSRYCEIEWVFVEPQGVRAEVSCKSTEDAVLAIRSLDGRWLEPLRGTLRVSWAGTKRQAEMSDNWPVEGLHVDSTSLDVDRVSVAVPQQQQLQCCERAEHGSEDASRRGSCCQAARRGSRCRGPRRGRAATSLND